MASRAWVARFMIRKSGMADHFAGQGNALVRVLLYVRCAPFRRQVSSFFSKGTRSAALRKCMPGRGLQCVGQANAMKASGQCMRGKMAHKGGRMRAMPCFFYQDGIIADGGCRSGVAAAGGAVCCCCLMLLRHSCMAMQAAGMKNGGSPEAGGPPSVSCRAGVELERDRSGAGRVGSHFSSGRPAAFQASVPPSMCRTDVNPSSRNTSSALPLRLPDRQ